MITRLENPAEAAELFGSFEDTMVLSCLSGMMGGVYAVAEWPLCSAAAVLGDFAFFAGQPSEELLRFRPEGRSYVLLTPQNDAWAVEIRRVFGKAASPRTRYAFEHSAEGFVPKDLREMAERLPEGVTLSPIDEALYRRCLSEEWTREAERRGLANHPTELRRTLPEWDWALWLCEARNCWRARPVILPTPVALRSRSTREKISAVRVWRGPVEHG